MFYPPSMLKIFTIIYDRLDIGQALDVEVKLGYKSHKSLIRHQKSYNEMTPRLLDFLAPKNRDLLERYLSSVQRFFCTLNDPVFETELNENEALNVYWNYIYAPMLATLLHTFSNKKYSGDTINVIGKILISWNENEAPKKRAKWAREAIKKKYDFKAPIFTQCVNDIRDEYVQSRATIKNILNDLNQELHELDELENDEIIRNLSYISAVYSSVMIIKRIEKNGGGNYLSLIKDSLIKLKEKDINSDLLNLHKAICHKLLYKELYIWAEEELIDTLLTYMQDELQATYPAIIEDLYRATKDPTWPGIQAEKCYYKKVICQGAYNPSSPLELVLMDYIKMCIHIEKGNLEVAYDYCMKVEKYSRLIYLGAFKSSNLFHKIALTWINKGRFIHNQFESDISELIMNLPDELDIIPEATNNNNFCEFYSSLNDHEVMMLRVFKKYNFHHESTKADPIKKLTNVINSIIELCHSNNDPSDKILPILKKSLEKKIIRTRSILPFTEKLTFTNSGKMINELYSYLNLPQPEELIFFNSDKRCKELLIELDKP